MPETYDFKLKPFLRITYTSAQAKEYWQPILEKAQQVPDLYAERNDPNTYFDPAYEGQGDGQTGCVDREVIRHGLLESCGGPGDVQGYSVLSPLLTILGIRQRYLWFPPNGVANEWSREHAYFSLTTPFHDGAATPEIVEALERIGEQPVLLDFWRGILIFKTPIFVGDTDCPTYKERQVIRFTPLEEKHHKFGIIPHMAHGTEFPYLTRQEYRRKLIDLKQV